MNSESAVACGLEWVPASEADGKYVTCVAYWLNYYSKLE